MGINPAGIHVFFVDKHNSDKKTGKTIIMYLVFNQYKNTDPKKISNNNNNKQTFGNNLVVIVCIIIEPMPLNICSVVIILLRTAIVQIIIKISMCQSKGLLLRHIDGYPLQYYTRL